MEEAQGRDFAARLRDLGAAPADDAVLELIVRRPAVDERELLGEARLDVDLGLIGDRWSARDVRATPAYLAAQLTLISTRVLAAIEPDRSRWPLAGDQLYVDMDLGVANLPPGTRLGIGSAVVEVSDAPHTGCAKFGARFGGDALRWINSPVGRALRMRGMNVRVVGSGLIRIGDRVRKAQGGPRSGARGVAPAESRPRPGGPGGWAGWSCAGPGVRACQRRVGLLSARRPTLRRPGPRPEADLAPGFDPE